MWASVYTIHSRRSESIITVLDTYECVRMSPLIPPNAQNTVSRLQKKFVARFVRFLPYRNVHRFQSMNR